jgi:hypothetical protein
MQKLFGFILSLSLIFVSSPAFSEEGKVMATDVQGSVMLVRDGQEIPVMPGMTFSNQDTLKTSDSCQLDITMNNKAACRVLASSTVSVTSTETDTMRIQIEKGNAILNLETLPSGTTFELETPTAIASVRGTQFWGRVDTKDTNNAVTTFAVRKGAVQVKTKNTGGNFTLTTGQALDIPTNATGIPTVRAALPEEMDAMNQADGIKIA